MIRHFMLDEQKQAVPVADIQVWLAWYNHADRRVALTEVGDLRVSTVFTGRFRDHPGFLFETLVFQPDGNICDFGQREYRTWQSAARGHDQVVEEAKRQTERIVTQTVRQDELDADLRAMLDDIEGL